jgi:hypothetical protein
MNGGRGAPAAVAVAGLHQGGPMLANAPQDAPTGAAEGKSPPGRACHAAAQDRPP